MAAVTLANLMDPLSKIEAATEASAETLGAIVSAQDAQLQAEVALITRLDRLIQVQEKADSLGAGDLLLAREMKRQTSLLKKIAGAKSGGGAAGAIGDGGKKLKEGAIALKALGAGAGTLAKGLIVFNFVPKGGITKFKDTVKDLFDMMTQYKTKDLKEGAEAFALMANSIGKFATGLVKAALLLPIGLLGIKLLGIVLKAATPIFKKLGKESKDINKGAKALDLMGTGLLSFAKGLALAGIVSVVGLIAVPFLILSIALIGAAFFLLGKIATPINRGSRALDKMGDALKSFALGLAGFALVTFFILMKPIILVGMVASLVLIGGAVAILGKMSRQIRKGTATLALMGLGIALFGLGYAIFASQFPENVGLMDIVVQAAAIALIGGAVALVGKFGLKNSAVGALALVMNGLGLLVFNLGYKPFAEATAGLSLGDVIVQAAVLIGVGIAVALVGKFGIANLAMGAGSFALIGIGLLVFNLGYVDFAAATKGMTLGDVGIQAAVLTAVGGLMTLAGIAVAASAGTALLGPALFAAAGGALLLLAPGLQAMRDLKYTAEDGKDLATTLGVVSMAFSGAKPDEGFFASVGGMFSRAADSGAGIAAAAMYAAAGLSLRSLSKGLAAFKAVGFTEKDGRDLALSLGAVSTGFAQAGGEAASPGGLFGAVFGNAFSPNAVEKGIDSVMNSAGALTSIAKGLTAFKGIEDPEGVAKKISLTLGLVGNAFASIGGNKDSKKALFGLIKWDENKIEKGIEAINGAGDALTDIAKGLKAFSGDFEPVTVAKAVGTLLTSIGTAFSDLYTANPEMSEELDDFKSFIVTLGDVAEKGQLDDAADGISKIADSINKIDIDKAVSFGNLFASANSLTSNRGAYKALANAVEDIRDMMAEPTGGPTFLEGAQNFMDGGNRGQSATGGSSDLKKTLNSLNRTIGGLPNQMRTAIATADITVKLDGN